MSPDEVAECKTVSVPSSGPASEQMCVWRSGVQKILALSNYLHTPVNRNAAATGVRRGGMEGRRTDMYSIYEMPWPPGKSCLARESLVHVPGKVLPGFARAKAKWVKEASSKKLGCAACKAPPFGGARPWQGPCIARGLSPALSDAAAAVVVAAGSRWRRRAVGPEGEAIVICKQRQRLDFSVMHESS